MKTLVLGLGNPLLSDDSVGIRVAEFLRDKINQGGITVEEASVGGLNLLDLLVGFDKAIIIDAIQTESGQAGQIYRLNLESFDAIRRSATSHDLSLTNALELGNRLRLALPKYLTIFAVEAKEVSFFSEQCSPQVEAAIPACAKMVMVELLGDKPLYDL
ncbi:hydrogenase maturation protease [Chloroflexota bacterium]